MNSFDRLIYFHVMVYTGNTLQLKIYQMEAMKKILLDLEFGIFSNKGTTL